MGILQALFVFASLGRRRGHRMGARVILFVSGGRSRLQKPARAPLARLLSGRRRRAIDRPARRLRGPAGRNVAPGGLA
jgi:hypothetical protein